jgi:hypothetical protein
MKLKNSLISIAAAGALVAGLTGCGGGGTAGDNDDNGTPQELSLKSSISGFDGNVINPKVYAVFSDGTQKLIENGVTLADTDNGERGKPTYSVLGELTADEQAKLVGYKLAPRAATADSDATFFDHNGNGLKDDEDIYVNTNFLMYIPAGMSYSTPLTTLVKASLDSTDTDTSKVSEKAKAIADKLGFTFNDFEADPNGLKESNPAYVLFTSLSGILINDGTPIEDLGTIADNILLDSTPAVTSEDKYEAAAELAESLAKATENVHTRASAMFENTAIQLRGNPEILDQVPNMHLDKVRIASEDGTFTPILATSVTKPFKVTSVKVGDTHVSSLVTAGAKLTAADLNNTVLQIDAEDKNGSASGKFDLILKFGSESTRMIDPANKDEIVAKISFDLNTTVIGGTDMNGTVTDDIKVDYVTNNGTPNTQEHNLSINIDDYVQINESNITIKAEGILQAIENNISDVNYSTDNKVAALQMILIDHNSTMVRTNTHGQFPWYTAYTSSTYGDIRGTGYAILNLADKDSNKMFDLGPTGGTTGKNKKPDHTLTLETAAAAGEGNSSDPYVLNADNNYSMKLAATTTDATEDNSTAKFTFTGNSLLSTYADDENITTALKAVGANTATTGDIVVPTTLNAVTDSGELNGTISVVVTDEFGLTSDANNTLYFTLNRSPYNVDGNDSNITSTSKVSIPFGEDDNLTKNGSDANQTDINTTRFISILDYDGNDFNSSVGGITFADVNVSTLERNTTDTNVSLDGNNIVFLNKTTGAEVNASFVFSADNKFIINFETNDTTITNHSFEGNVTISEYNLTDKYGAIREFDGDANITLYFDLNGSL